MVLDIWSFAQDSYILKAKKEEVGDNPGDEVQDELSYKVALSNSFLSWESCPRGRGGRSGG